ncbi:MAG: hypothetical protein ACFE9L_01245 [Candidatus Hodarchaeota archaeon]
MLNNYEMLKELRKKKKNKKEAIEDLSRFYNQEENHEWHGVGDPAISDNENIILVIQGVFTLYEDFKLSDSSIIWTNDRTILFGNIVQKTLIASTLSREIEKRRGFITKPKNLLPLKKKGWDIPHNQIQKVEIIKSGEIFSFFFYNGEKRVYIINDLERKEMEIIENFLITKNNIEVIQDEFVIPLIDILLLILIGIVITIISWIIIAIIL